MHKVKGHINIYVYIIVLKYLSVKHKYHFFKNLTKILYLKNIIINNN